MYSNWEKTAGVRIIHDFKQWGYISFLETDKISKVILCRNKLFQTTEKEKKKKDDIQYTAKVFVGDQDDVISVSSPAAVCQTLLLFTVQKSSHPNNRWLLGFNNANHLVQFLWQLNKLMMSTIAFWMFCPKRWESFKNKQKKTPKLCTVSQQFPLRQKKEPSSIL